jgi:hypothetical protein
MRMSDLQLFIAKSSQAISGVNVELNTKSFRDILPLYLPCVCLLRFIPSMLKIRITDKQGQQVKLADDGS